MREIKKNNILVALILNGSLGEGTKPLTDEHLALQIIALNHPRGKVLPPHSHKPRQRTTESLMEALMVFSGRVKVDIYYQREIIESVDLARGQGVMIVNGGIGIEVLEDAEMMEFKNGPFLEDKILL